LKFEIENRPPTLRELLGTYLKSQNSMESGAGLGAQAIWSWQWSLICAQFAYAYRTAPPAHLVFQATQKIRDYQQISNSHQRTPNVEVTTRVKTRSVGA
jgi:hypothetical protein